MGGCDLRYPAAGCRRCASSVLLAGDCGLFPQSDTFRLELAKNLDVLF
jgi:hypothetical protein